MSSAAFLLDPKEWLSDVKVLGMDLDAQAIHFKFICLAAMDKTHPCTLSADQHVLQRLAGNPAGWERILQQVLTAWQEENGRLVQLDLLVKYKKRQAFCESRRQNALGRNKKKVVLNGAQHMLNTSSAQADTSAATRARVDSMIEDTSSTGELALFPEGLNDKSTSSIDDARDDVAREHVFVGEVKTHFLRWQVTKNGFSRSDRTLAAKLFRDGVPIERIRRAILLGSIRKFKDVHNNGTSERIVSLQYFASLLGDEALDSGTDFFAQQEKTLKAWERKYELRKPPAKDNPATGATQGTGT